MSMAYRGTSVYNIAAELENEANRKVTNHIGDPKYLKGNAAEGKYTQRGNESQLNNICAITIQHSNDSRTGDNYKGPCTGKGNDENRFAIGVEWKPDHGNVKDGHEGVLLPPRRRHMCTSNLENLNVCRGNPLVGGNVGNNGKLANDSFLGDVLLSAYKEAEWIKTNYSDRGDHSAVCRAVRNSFADIGDIIRGRDVWTKEEGNKDLQIYLTKIFNKIKDIDDIKGKYTNGENESPPYKTLREHWWVANRDKVWEAMKCHVGDYMAFSVLEQGRGGLYRMLENCGFRHNVTPLDDYIPQRLRWMTEWVENFCKAQHSDYMSVKDVCDKCKGGGNGQCVKGSDDCKLCSAMCGTYGENVEKWKTQWTKMETKYKELYEKANNGGKEFMKNIKEKGKPDYENAAGYVQDIGNFDYCKKGRLSQKQQYKLYDTRGNSNDENYAFRSQPKDYDNECKCNQEDRTMTKAVEPSGGVPGGPTLSQPPVVTPRGQGLPTSHSRGEPGSSSGGSSSRTPCKRSTIEIKELKDGNAPLKICDDNNKNSLDGTAYKLGIFFEGNKSRSGTTNTENIPLLQIYNGYSFINRSSRNPCGNHSLERKKWICDENGNNNKYNPNQDKVCLPPRTQILCVGNLNVDPDTSTTSGGKKPNIVAVDSPKKLLTEALIAAKYEGGNLKNNYNKMNENSQYFCSKVKYSFGDLADIIKGRNIYGLPTNDKTKSNLDTIFNNIYKKLENKQKYTDTGGSNEPKYTKLREDWWKANRAYVWKILLRNAAPTNIPDCLEKYENTPPDIDTTPQLLRFVQEWSDEYCVKRKTLADEVVKKCNECKKTSEKYHTENTIGSSSSQKYTGKEEKKCENIDSNDDDCGDCNKKCNDCKDACSKYTKFVEGNADNDNDENIKWRDRWKHVEKIYIELIDKAKKSQQKYHEEQREKTASKSPSDHIPPYMMKCDAKKDEVCLKPDVDSFFQNLAENGYTSLSSYINSVSEAIDCGNDEPKWGNTVVITTSGTSTTDTYPQPFGDKAVGYKYACECRIPSREELCRDNQLYRNRWVCDTSGSTPLSNYYLCRDKLNNNTRSNAPHSQVAGTTLSKEDIEFFNLFDLWYKDIQNRLDHNIHRIKEQCDKDKIMAIPSGIGTSGQSTTGGKVSPLCLGCRDSCECYKRWVNHMQKQWEKQKDNFTKFEKSNGSNNVTLNHFLFASCWEDYLQKSNRRTDINSLDADTHGDTIDVLIDRCGKKINEAQTNFQKRIDKANKETKECDKNQERCKKNGEELKCTAYSDVRACGEKTYDNNVKGSGNHWLCTDGKILENGVCLPPRTKTLCVANMYGSVKGQYQLLIQVGGDKEKLKEYIKNAMKMETENLYNYYKSGKPIITTSGQNDQNGLPKNFCKAAERTYNDFKHMVMGDIPWKATSFSQIHGKIKEILEKNNGIHNNVQTPQEWWDIHSDEFWDAVKCGIKKQTKPDGSRVNFSGDECGEFPPDDTDNQFVWWFKEWGQQFCFERQKHIKEINDKCESSESKRCNSKDGKLNDLRSECKTECDNYNNFIQRNRDAWNKQKNKYEREHPGMFAEELLGHEYPECLEANFENIFEENDTQKSKKSKRELKYPYGDARDICSCEQQIYSSSGNISTCKDKKGDVITWRTHLLKIGKDNKKLEGVYAPPRRQKLCLANLYPINFGKDEKDNIENKKNTLLNRLQIVAEREAYYIWKFYHPNNTTSKTGGATDTDEDKKACCSIRSSFFDIGDIVKGTDLWDDPSKKYIDKILNDIFEKDVQKKKNNQIKPEQIKQARKTWWDYYQSGNSKIKDKVWDAMQKGVTNAMEQLNKNGKTYENIDCMKDDNNVRNFHIFATPQFLRWLEEWTQQFCEEYTKYIVDVVTMCASSGGNNNDCNYNSNNGCKNACTKYNDWISLKRKEWNGMSKYYTSIYRTDQHNSPDGTDYSDVMQSTAIDYLNQKCMNNIDGKNKCCYCENVGMESKSSTGKEPLEHMYKVVNRNDTRYWTYKPRCTNCQLKHIKDQIKKIEHKIKERQDKKNAASSGSGVKPATAAKPIATKPEVPRQQASKPVATKKPETDGRSSQKTPTPTPTGTQQSKNGPGPTKVKSQNQGKKAPASSTTCTGVDSGSDGDGGLCQRIGVTSYTAQGGRGSTAVVSIATQRSSAGNGHNTSAGNIQQGSPAPTTSTTSGSGNNPSQKQDDGTFSQGQTPATWKLPSGTANISNEKEQLKKKLKETITENITLLSNLWKNHSHKLSTYSQAGAAIGAMGTILITQKINEHVISPAREHISNFIEELKNSSSSKSQNTNFQLTSSSIGATSTTLPEPGAGPGISGPQGVQTGQQGTGVQGQGTLPAGGRGQQQKTRGRGKGQKGSKSPKSPKSTKERGTPTLNEKLPVGTIPLTIGVVFGAIAYLWLKKKPKSSPVDLLRVIDIPQNDYGIPDEASTNRYVPYGRYKGKTYIYVEGEEKDDYSYVRDISSSDITSSSESEYEELDINDIYPYKSEKYKTLIEVVLVPSNKTYDVQATHDIHYKNDTSMYQKDDSNKITYEEWNKLKHEFISQYLKYLPSGMDHELPNENNIDDNMYKDTPPDVNILHVNKEEKPFITQIQDRVLYNGDEEVTYNIDWNVLENINRDTNTMDIPQYTSNIIYTGVDLINDSLNCDQHVDIYDEMLKRKENELFGTNHTKHTSTYSVAKQTYSDPISNKIDLFHK